ncbi:P-loop containing nucleoside triphosphate hydrolase protein [Hygrophoropsis aurantiaca]|uniref:P-loop containing nucleoside triphosphate hydrolase protein n=1 Tax=Hygrophoropsis aurantiaca TaxID=72124 RepID=A0ACB7ZX65_9AGAM|nr:P-loop containing nucleoside triphosphate hydrolase protein [Hygrophoropsis aurantiaca]
MPSPPIYSALLVLGNSEGLPWNIPAWQAITKVHGIPWQTVDGAADMDKSPYVARWTVKVAKAVKVFAQNAWSRPIEPNLQDDYIVTRKADNDSAGRKSWKDFVMGNLVKWKLNKIVDEVFESEQRSPYDVLAAHETRKLPTMEDAQLGEARVSLAYRLFGGDALMPKSSNSLKPPFRKFVDALIVLTWNRYRKANSRETSKLDSDLEEITELWTAMTAEGADPKAKDIRKFLLRIQKASATLVKYQDQESVDLLKKYAADLQGIMASAAKDEESPEGKKLPKALRDALNKLASEEDIVAINRLVRASLENIQGDTSQTFELDLDDKIDISDWREGVEELKDVSEDRLWDRLGFPDKKLPFFQEWMDPEAMVQPWSEEGEAWLNDPDGGRQRLKPRWHQLVGILRILERAFDGEPILLMDGVGLGKTLQAVGAIACLTFYQEYFEANQRFPGQFAGKTFGDKTKDGKIPNDPHLIVCPVNLKDQWQAEMERFLTPWSFDILPYTGKYDSRSEWWTQLYDQSKQPVTRRIILGTLSAIQDDSLKVHRNGVKEKAGEPLPKSQYADLASSTLWSKRFGFFIMDEAHAARKANNLHVAARALRERAAVMVAMTATPVTTNPQASTPAGKIENITSGPAHRFDRTCTLYRDFLTW